MDIEQIFEINDRIKMTATKVPSVETLNRLKGMLKKRDYFAYLLWLDSSLTYEEKKKEPLAWNLAEAELIEQFSWLTSP